MKSACPCTLSATLTLTLTLTLALALLLAGAAAADVAVVQRDLLGVHARPDASAPVIDRARDGERLAILERQGNWLRVSTGFSTGWVPGGLVRVEATSEDSLDPGPVEPAVPPRTAGRPTMPAAPPSLPPVAASSVGLGEATSVRTLRDVALAPPVRRHLTGRAVLYDGSQQRVTVGSAQGGAVAVFSLGSLSLEARLTIAKAVVRGEEVTVVFDEVPEDLLVPAVAVVSNGLAWR